MTSRSRAKTMFYTVLGFVAALSFGAALVFFIQPRWLISLVAAKNPDVLFYVNTTEKVMALSIDDGPDSLVTPQILDVLKQYSARATFFLLGDRVRGNEDLILRIKREGHELANHLMADHPSILLGSEEFESQLVRVDSLLNLNHQSKWFRPGSGWFSQQMLAIARKHGHRCCLGSIYPHDTKIRNTWAIATYVKKRAFPGGIIVLHDGSPDRVRTVEVLHDVLPPLIDQGYRFLTISELVETAGR